MALQIARPNRHLTSWLLWLALLALAVGYLAELVREMTRFDWSPAMLLLQVGLAVLVLAPLALANAVLQQQIYTGTLTQRVRLLLTWTPRAILVVFATLLASLALDVFGAGYGPWQTLAALAIHLVPAVGMLAVLGLAWRWPLAGTLALTAWAAWYVLEAWGRFPLSVYAVVSGLPLGMAVLFLLTWWLHDESAPSA